MPTVKPTNPINPRRLASLMRKAKMLAKDYRHLTGRPLGITGEVAEFEAARLLGLELAPVRQNGFDVLDRRGGRVRRLQVKGRVLFANAKPGQRLSRISLKHKWEAALLVILNEDFEPQLIYEATRAAISKAMLAPGSKARNERGQLGLSKFKSIGKIVWPKDDRRPRHAAGRA